MGIFGTPQPKLPLSPIQLKAVDPNSNVGSESIRRKKIGGASLLGSSDIGTGANATLLGA